MSQEWHYSVDGAQLGPVSAAELKKLAEAGKLKQADLVWKDGMADWVPAKSIKGLFGAAASSAGTPKADQPAAAAPDTDERPSSRGRPRDEDEDRPRRRRQAEPEEDERPSRSRRREEPAAENDRPSRSRNREEPSDEERPVRRRRDEEEDRPRRKRGGARVPEDTPSKKMTAGLLGILIGWTGAHRFYLGDTTGGVIRLLVLNLVCAGGVVGLIEGIIYLTKSDEDFHREYIVGQKAWF